MADLIHAIKLVVGDWSGDGHEKTSSISIIANIPKDEIESAYIRGCAKLGFDFQARVAREFEDKSLREHEFEALVEAGFSSPNWNLEVDGEWEDIDLDADSYAELWLFVVKLGAPEFEYKVEQQSRINIGGYGLFSI